MTEGHQQPSTPDLGGINPADAAADILATIQDAAQETVAQDAAKMVIVTVETKVADQADVTREYADTPDGLNYPMINAAVRPIAGDQALAIERPGGMVIIGKAWAPGDPDLNTVRSGDDMLSNAVDNRVLAGGPDNADRAVDTSNIKRGAVTNEILANPNGHSHDISGSTSNAGAHSHNITGSTSSGGGHTHKYGYYTKLTGQTWVANGDSTSNDGGHDHGSGSGGTALDASNAGGHDHSAGEGGTALTAKSS